MADAASEQTTNCVSSSLCSICIHPVKDARILSCLHSFCKTCIDDLHLKTAHDHEVSCPHCGDHTCLPENGAAGLPKDITRAPAKREFECENCKQDDKDGKSEAWCKKCDMAFCKEHVISHVASTGHSICAVPNINQDDNPRSDHDSSPSRLCSLHNLPLRYFCQKCKVSVCEDCVVFGEHVAHIPVVTMKEVSQELQQSTMREIDRVESVDLPRLEKSLSSVKRVSKLLSSRAAKCRSQIRAAGKRAADIIQGVVDRKLIEVDNIETGRLKKLHGQEDDLTHHVDDLKRYTEIGKNLLKQEISDNQDVGDMLLVLDKRAETLGKVNIAEEPVQHPGVGLQQVDDVQVLSSAMGMVGEIFEETVSAHHSHIDCPKKHCVIGSSVRFRVVAYDHNGKRMRRGGDEVEAKVLDDNDGGGSVSRRVPDLKVSDKRDGTYLFSCTPQVGKYTVEVSINGEKVQERLSLSCVHKSNMTFRDDLADKSSLKFSPDRQSVTCTKSFASCPRVFCSKAMDAGQHTWKVRIQSGISHVAGQGNAFIGLAWRQITANEHNTVPNNLGWFDDGSSRVLNERIGTTMSRWKENDVLQIDLDCDEHVSRITNLRNGESDKINDLPAVTFYAFFLLAEKNYTITLLQ